MEYAVLDGLAVVVLPSSVCMPAQPPQALASLQLLPMEKASVRYRGQDWQPWVLPGPWIPVPAGWYPAGVGTSVPA